VGAAAVDDAGLPGDGELDTLAAGDSAAPSTGSPEQAESTARAAVVTTAARVRERPTVPGCLIGPVPAQAAEASSADGSPVTRRVSVAGAIFAAEPLMKSLGRESRTTLLQAEATCLGSGPEV
jgi:hypothetical protein